MIKFLSRLLGAPVARKARAQADLFLAAAEKAPEVQRALLARLVERTAPSQFGRDHFFHEIQRTEDFRSRVPIGGYDRHEPYIDRVRQGDTGALFGPGTDVLMFALTSGTTNRPKTIPVTRESLADYRAGWTTWGILAFDSHPAMMKDGLKPILQLASDWRERTTPSGIPCGAITGLTAHMQSRLVRTKYCMPEAASLIKDVEAKYYVALRSSIHRDLGTIIAANPSTILAIARLGDRLKETLIRDTADGTIDPRFSIPGQVLRSIGGKLRRKRKRTARALEDIANRTGRLLPKDYWPNLQFLSNWTGGTMRAYLRGYPEYFGDRPVRDVGLIASEGRMTIPIEDGTPAGVLDVLHHYFEFIPAELADSETPDVVEAADLIEGRDYFIVMTTAGGLFRYNIHDMVRCRGFVGRAPLIEFLNKGAHFSSLSGEKLSEHQVVAAVERAQRALNLALKSYLLVPEWGEPPRYVLLVEQGDLPHAGSAQALASRLEHELRAQNDEYDNRQQTLRLAPATVRAIADGGWAEFQRRRLAQSGGALEQYKQPHLSSDLELLASFLIPSKPGA